MPSITYDSFQYDALTGNIDIDTDTFKVMLVSSAYTEDKALHMKRSSVTGEITGTGYVAGGFAIVPTITKDTANHRVIITFPQLQVPNSAFTARKAVYYKARGGAASADEVICCDDFGADVTTANETFTLSPTIFTLPTPS